MRRSLVATACAVALLSPVPVSIALAGSAAAEIGDFSVVGMSQEQAETALSEADIPYVILNRAGNKLKNCRVTEQRDRGYTVEDEWEWDSGNSEWTKTETEVWRGVALVVFCD